eukprot:4684806-Amphidinium_carterae.1
MAANAVGAAAEPSLQTTAPAAQELAEQLYTVLMSLTDGESFDLVMGAGEGERPGGVYTDIGTHSPQAELEDSCARSSHLVARSLLNHKALSSA